MPCSTPSRTSRRPPHHSANGGTASTTLSSTSSVRRPIAGRNTPTTAVLTSWDSTTQLLCRPGATVPSYARVGMQLAARIGSRDRMGVLDDKVAIVTGSARGIGRATAELLAAQGAKVADQRPRRRRRRADRVARSAARRPSSPAT